MIKITQMKRRKTKQNKKSGGRRSAASLQVWPQPPVSWFFTVPLTLIIAKWFAWFLLVKFHISLRFGGSSAWHSHMDSPLSKSPGSSVLIVVGLPTTLPSSALGGPHRLEYCGTPPHSISLHALPPDPVPPDPPPPPRLLLFQWLMECVATVPPPPSRVWLVPGLACQLVVGVRDWPCAKKRFNSSSPANSASIVVFPRTHLESRYSET